MSRPKSKGGSKKPAPPPTASSISSLLGIDLANVSASSGGGGAVNDGWLQDLQNLVKPTQGEVEAKLSR